MGGVYAWKLGEQLVRERLCGRCQLDARRCSLFCETVEELLPELHRFLLEAGRKGQILLEAGKDADALNVSFGLCEASRDYADWIRKGVRETPKQDSPSQDTTLQKKR